MNKLFRPSAQMVQQLLNRRRGCQRIAVLRIPPRIEQREMFRCGEEHLQQGQTIHRLPGEVHHPLVPPPQIEPGKIIPSGPHPLIQTENVDPPEGNRPGGFQRRAGDPPGQIASPAPRRFPPELVQHIPEHRPGQPLLREVRKIIHIIAEGKDIPKRILQCPQIPFILVPGGKKAFGDAFPAPRPPPQIHHPFIETANLGIQIPKHLHQSPGILGRGIPGVPPGKNIADIPLVEAVPRENPFEGELPGARARIPGAHRTPVILIHPPADIHLVHQPLPSRGELLPPRRRSEAGVLDQRRQSRTAEPRPRQLGERTQRRTERPPPAGGQIVQIEGKMIPPGLPPGIQ